MTIKQEGRRYYIMGDTYSLRERLKSAGCHWDADRRAWWTGDRATADKFATAQTPQSTAKAENPDEIRLVGKAKYKGRTYYIRWMGQTSRGTQAARLVSLDATIDFWADLDQIEIVKRYEPREERGRYGRSTGRTVHTTLGSIRSYIERMKREDPQGIGRDLPDGYYVRGGEILATGCSECASLGHMCPTCRHDYE